MSNKQNNIQELLSAIKEKSASDNLDCDDLFKDAWRIENITLETKYELYGLNIDNNIKKGLVEDGLILCDAYINCIPKDDNQLIQLSDAIYLQVKLLGLKGEVKNALDAATTLVSKLKKTSKYEERKCLANILHQAALLRFRSGEVPKALELLSESGAICKDLKYLEVQTEVYLAYAQIYSFDNNFERALEYTEKVIALRIQTQNKPKLAIAYMSHALTLEHTINYDKAKTFYLKGLTLAEQMKSTRLIAYFQANLISLYVKMDDLKAFKLLEKEIIKNPFLLENKEFAANAYYKLANAHLISKDFKAGYQYAKELIMLREKQGNLASLRAAYLLQKDLLKGLKDYESLCQCYNKIVAINEKLLNEKNQKSLQELEIKYENERKENQIQSLKIESVSFQLQSLRAQMNPHFIFNTIASISQDLHPDAIPKSQKLLESFARLMRANLDFAEEEKITLEEEIKFLHDYLLLEQNRLGNKLTFSINYPDDLDLDFIEIPSMIIQPYIENAVKHGIMPLQESGEIKVSFKETGEQIICTIEDNGIGRKAAEKRKEKGAAHLGKSTSINAKRLALLSPKIKNKLQVNYKDKVDEQGDSKGTIVEISI